MALVNCPECKKEVSSTALSCPYCGFGVKDYFGAIQKKTEEQAEYERTHKEIEIDDNSWFELLYIYDNIVERVSKISEDIVKYKTIWFNDGIPSYPLDFCNEWFECIQDGYIDVWKIIRDGMSRISCKEIKNNFDIFDDDDNDYDYVATMRLILGRWNRLVMEPFENNSPAILQTAEHSYSLQVQEDSKMGFGIITNSMVSIALYAIQSSIKESNAIKKARQDKYAYINSEMSTIQRSVSTAWHNHFNEFLADVELLHQVFLFELGQGIFNGLKIGWNTIDEVFNRKEVKERYLAQKKQFEDKMLEQSAKKEDDRISALNAKRQKFVNEQTALIAKLNDEITSCKNEIETIGFVLFGEKADRKKQLKAQIRDAEIKIGRIKPILEKIRNRTPIKDEFYTHRISGQCPALGLLRKDDALRISYNEKDDCYEVLFPVAEGFYSILQLESYFTYQYGPYREFSARLRSYETTYENSYVCHSDIDYRITSID